MKPSTGQLINVMGRGFGKTHSARIFFNEAMDNYISNAIMENLRKEQSKNLEGARALASWLDAEFIEPDSGEDKELVEEYKGGVSAWEVARNFPRGRSILRKS